MTSLRFATVGDLYEAFPTARHDVGIDANDEPSLAFLEMLASMKVWDAAISFCAYVLRRREAVWWGCYSLRQMIQLTAEEAELLAVAENWVRQPDEKHRWAAADRAAVADSRVATTWMALAAAWSGGSIGRTVHRTILPAPEQTARAIRAGLMIGLSTMLSQTTDDVLRQCVQYGRHLAAGEVPQ
jgi:uncharacterized protein DUF6931